MSTSIETFKREIKSLSPEILLKIFLNLDSHETVILRSVCKEFLEIIDNNKSLWRVLDWIQEKDGSAVQALEKFDEKSASTLKEVSIFQEKGELDKERLIEVLNRSKDSLRTFSLRFEDFEIPQELTLRDKVLGLASSSPLLKRLVFWFSSDHFPSHFPETRLIHSSRGPTSFNQQSNSLHVLWCWNFVGEWYEKGDVSSLVSLADSKYQEPAHLRSIISRCSSNLLHLSISIRLSSLPLPPPLSCSSLQILEGEFNFGFPSWLDFPKLRTLIVNSISRELPSNLPLSIKELWLLSWNYDEDGREWNLDGLLDVGPNLKILKIGEEFFEDEWVGERVVDLLRTREIHVREGHHINGIKMVSLEKLIIPTKLFGSEELDDLRGMVNEVIDIEDYPNFIELEY